MATYGLRFDCLQKGRWGVLLVSLLTGEQGGSARGSSSSAEWLAAYKYLTTAFVAEAKALFDACLAADDEALAVVFYQSLEELCGALVGHVKTCAIHPPTTVQQLTVLAVAHEMLAQALPERGLVGPDCSVLHTKVMLQLHASLQLTCEFVVKGDCRQLDLPEESTGPTTDALRRYSQKLPYGRQGAAMYFTLLQVLATLGGGSVRWPQVINTLVVEFRDSRRAAELLLWHARLSCGDADVVSPAGASKLDDVVFERLLHRCGDALPAEEVWSIICAPDRLSRARSEEQDRRDDEATGPGLGFVPVNPERRFPRPRHDVTGRWISDEGWEFEIK
eukprot:gene6089-9351_t